MRLSDRVDVVPTTATSSSLMAVTLAEIYYHPEQSLKVFEQALFAYAERYKL